MKDKSQRFSCAADCIEGYDASTELKVNCKYWVFWSPEEDESPASYLVKQKRIMHVTDSLLRQNKGKAMAGYYECTLLLFAG